MQAEESWWFPSGLANRIAYSGATAIEMMGVGFPGAEMVSPIVGQVYARTTAGDRWLTWAIRTDDIDATAQRLGIDVMDEGFAMTLAGERVSWRTAGVVEAFFSEPYLPFFVSYTHGEDGWRSRALNPEPAFDVSHIVLSGDPERLATWLGDASLPIEVSSGPPEIRSVAISTPAGEVELRPNGR